jgi:hypothetical protein
LENESLTFAIKTYKLQLIMLKFVCSDCWPNQNYCHWSLKIPIKTI